MKAPFKKAVAWTALLTLLSQGIPTLAVENVPDTEISAPGQTAPVNADITYYSERERLTGLLVDSGTRLEYPVSSLTLPTSGVTPTFETHEYPHADRVWEIAPDTTFQVTLDVPQVGGYYIELDYYIPGDSLQVLEMDLKINGKSPYIDSQNMQFPAAWKDSSKDYKMDSYGGEIFPAAQRIYRWFTRFLNNATYHLTEPLIFELQEGENILEFTTNHVGFLLGAVRLIGKTDTLTYEEYIEQVVNGHTAAATPGPVVIEGEDFIEKSHSHIRGDRSKNYNFFPYDPRYTRINFLAETLWSGAGEAVTYEVEIPQGQGGLYRLALKYRQDTKENMAVYKNIYIDGQILFDGFQEYAFDFTGMNCRNHVLSYNGQEIQVYLEPGRHIITLESTASVYFEAYETLVATLSEMNDIALQIRMITGNKVDKNRDWNIEEYLPGLKEQLTDLADRLDGCYERLAELAGTENPAAIANIKIVSQGIRKFTVDRGTRKGLDDLVNNLSRFSQGAGSFTEYLSVVLDKLLGQPMAIDRLYLLAGEQTMPAANLGFFTALFEEIRKLFYSFTLDYDTVNLSSEKLNIWVNRPLTHIEILREMIESDFTAKTGIAVQLSAMPDENKLMLAVVDGNVPDGVIGLSMNKPFDLALRGALHDLREFDDFGQVMEPFSSNMFTPFVIEDRCYGLPETANFVVLFYRTDIMEKLDLEVPETWQDLINILPVLDGYGMKVNTPISSMDAFKNFNCTVPIIQQMGGRLYSEDGTQVLFSHPTTIEAFTLLTDLYTKYSMAQRINNFYQDFKNGVVPLGISDLNTYNLLKNAAPEIYGQWAIAPNLGIRDENGIINNTQPDVASSCVILESSDRHTDTWTFLKWWMEAETQLQYSTNLQLRFGMEYIWNTANLEALSQYSYFDTDEKTIILNQVRSAQEVPRHPAYFQVERELSNAFNNIVIDHQSVRAALDMAALSTNRVLQKKLKEFGYLSPSGELLKEFWVATESEIETWRGEKVP